MAGHPRSVMSFRIGTTDQEQLEVFSNHHRAFKAEKLPKKSTPPGSDDIHSRMDICGIKVPIGPGKTAGTGFEYALCCMLRAVFCVLCAVKSALIKRMHFSARTAK